MLKDDAIEGDAGGRAKLLPLDPEPGVRGRCPPENPDVDPITEELLIQPHPGEPGVGPDGTAAPLENPGEPPPLD